MTRSRCRSLLLVLFAFLPLPALASSASWQVGPFTVDIIPTTAGSMFSWNDGGTGYVFAFAETTPAPAASNLNSLDWFTTTFATASTAQASATQTVAPGASFNGTVSTVDAAPGNLLDRSNAQVQGQTDREFTTTGALSIHVTAPYSLLIQPGPEVRGYASTEIILSGHFWGAGGTTASEIDSACLMSTIPTCGLTLAKSGALDFTLVMPEAGIGLLQFLGSAQAGQLAAPVPEPSTYALMLAGLGFVGFVANRRRKSQTERVA